MKKPSRELIDAFLNWYKNDPHSNYEDKYLEAITLKNISSFSKLEFIDFFFQFAREGGLVQSGGQRTAGQFKATIEKNYDDFRRFVLEPFEKDFNETSWLEGIENFKGFGQGLATIYLNRVDKKRFAILNNKAVGAMQLMGVDVPLKLVPRYLAIRDGHKQLIGWYPEFDNFFRADAFTHFLIGEGIGQKWQAEFRNGGGRVTDKGGKKTDQPNYWIYAPGEHARFWDRYYQEGVMGLGWDTLPTDLSVFESEDKFSEYYNKIYGVKATDADFRQISDFLFKVRRGDHVFVKRGTSEIVGYGIVDSEYFYDQNRPTYRHLRKTKWMKNGQWALPEDVKALPVKTLTEIKDPKRVDSLLQVIGEAAGLGEGLDHIFTIFTEKTFDLLNELRKKPEASYYSLHGAEFSKEVEEPFQKLLRSVATRLPHQIIDLLETEKRIFSRIIKNDYGRGGAWDFYWGAFYPKGGKRTADGQLYCVLSPDGLKVGFYIGDYGIPPRKRFDKNSTDYAEELIRLLKPSLDRHGLVYGLRDHKKISEVSVRENPELTFEQWLSAPGNYGYEASFLLSPDTVLKLTAENLIERVKSAFVDLFPLLLMAHYEEPMEPLRLYLGSDIESPDANPQYAISQFAEEAFISEDQINNWVRAIQRKRQVIFYGPPGTGKTFVAKKLAQHLIGGGDGITEIIQFHPSFAYEDFIQGLRPRVLKSGGLEYAMIPGRFKDFCSRAQESQQTCVLIIDEINRANLSRVFGELMYLLEYRDDAVPLAGGERFQIPGNVFIIGTMNTADRSIALVDHALRRRFAFLPLYPNYQILKRYHEGSDFNPEGLTKVLDRLNATINDKHYSVGPSFFLHPDIKIAIPDIWRMEIEPYIEELFFDQPQKASSFAWDKIAAEILGE